MNSYQLAIIKNKLLVVLIIIYCNFLSSCGLKTPPQNIIERKSKSTINKMNVIQMGNKIRISWEIFGIERTNKLSKFYKDPFENESERNAIFGDNNIYYQKLKARLPKFTIDLICKWHQNKFKNLLDREHALKEWYFNQFNNDSEKEDAFSKLSDNQYLQDYFTIKERIKPFDCKNCESSLKKKININFTSKSLVREGNNLYYYIDITKNDLFLREYELSHHGPDNQILAPVKKSILRKNNLFPKVPIPNFKIIQIEDAKQTFQFTFGNVVIKDSKRNDNLTKKENDKLSILRNKRSDNNKVNGLIKFFIKISWPKINRTGLKRFRGKGDFFEDKKFFQVNLYRTRTKKYWPETPINFNSNTQNYFIDKIKLLKYSAKTKKNLDLKPNIPSSTIPFYVDLKGQNSDTWLYRIRLVDSFGNESLSSETITVNLPKNKIVGYKIID